jgi:hypothetical protein
MNKKEVFCLMVVMLVILSACQPAPKIKHTEYLVNGEWQRCQYVSEQACGLQLNCDGVNHICMTNVPRRAVD